jgi:hypothetical protein
MWTRVVWIVANFNLQTSIIEMLSGFLVAACALHSMPDPLRRVSSRNGPAGLEFDRKWASRDGIRQEIAPNRDAI